VQAIHVKELWFTKSGGLDHVHEAADNGGIRPESFFEKAHLAERKRQRVVRLRRHQPDIRFPVKLN
jgi:hypothetical protein